MKERYMFMYGIYFAAIVVFCVMEHANLSCHFKLYSSYVSPC